MYYSEGVYCTSIYKCEGGSEGEGKHQLSPLGAKVCKYSRGRKWSTKRGKEGSQQEILGEGITATECLGRGCRKRIGEKRGER